MAYNASFMMMASTPLLDGGLGLSVRCISVTCASLTNGKPWQLGLMLAISSILGVLIAKDGITFFVRRLGWYGTLRTTAFAHVVLFPLIALAGAIARYEGGIGSMTGMMLLLVLIAYEIGETSFT